MKHKVVAVLSIIALLTGMSVAVLPVGASPPPPLYDIQDVGPELRAWEPTRDRIVGPTPMDLPLDETGGGGEGGAGPTATILATKLWLALDDYCGYYYFKPYGLVGVGTHSEVWVALDLGWTGQTRTDCPLKETDPRDTPIITDEQVEYLLDEFDNNIYPTDTTFFGMPDTHDGTYSLLEAWGLVPPDYYDGDGDKILIMVDNVRDEQWYDETYPWYIAGFYSPSFEAYFDRNLISIDAKEWELRMGDDAEKPNLYEGVIAHELEHLIHDDLDPEEDTFVNEGCADFSEYLCGYGHPDGHLWGDGGISVLPENSLVAWEDQGGLEILADYGIAYLWTLYLYEIFGGPFIQAMAGNAEHGIAGINSTLAAFHIQKDFAVLYHDFSVAMLIHQEKKAANRYGFEEIDFNLDIGTPDAPNPEAIDTPAAPPWGGDYIWVDGDPKELAKFSFNGVDYMMNPTAWTSDGYVLYSGTGNLIDNWAIFEAQGGGTLNFDTYWDIEDYWDFGFVQVSTDGGYNWTSLANSYTTYDHDPLAHPTVVANLPGLTSWSCFVEDDCWVNMSFDLSAYAGQDILIAFRYVTDWGTLYEGWYIDNVYVDGTLVSDGSDANVFKDITELLPINNDFTVTFVGIQEKSKGNDYMVHTMNLDDATEEGLFELSKVLKQSDSAVMIVTSDAAQGTTSYADYTYEFTYTNAGPKKGNPPTR